MSTATIHLRELRQRVLTGPAVLVTPRQDAVSRGLQGRRLRCMKGLMAAIAERGVNGTVPTKAALQPRPRPGCGRWAGGDIRA